VAGNLKEEKIMATPPIASIQHDVLANILPTLSWFNNHSIQPHSEQPKNATLAPLRVASTQSTTATREQTLLEHLPLVRFVARRIHERLPQHVEMEDLVSAGVVGLIDAYNKFDTGKNVQFRSYAQFRIRGAILDSLRNLDWGSRELRRKGRALEEAIQKLTQQLSRKPAENEIAVELGMSLSEYHELVCELKNLEVGSLHETRSEDSAEEELAYLPTAPEEDPFFRCMQGEMKTHLTAAIESLPEREARVLALYYIEEMTLKEIGRVLNLVESRVSQIRAAAITNLRARLTRGGKSMDTGLPTNKKRPQAYVPAAILQRNAVSAHQRGRMRVSAR